MSAALERAYARFAAGPAVASHQERVVVLGLGRAGLPTAAAFARAGFDVVASDPDPERVEALARDPAASLRPLVDAGRLSFEADAAARGADAVLVCVEAHDDALADACAAVGRDLAPGSLVVFEAVTSPGATRRLRVPLLERASGLVAGEDLAVACCPERAHAAPTAIERAARALGALDDRSLDRALRLYARVVDAPLHLCPDLATAEAARAFEEAERHVLAALRGELARLAAKIGLDAREVGEATRSMGSPPWPAPVGPPSILEAAAAADVELRLLAAARGAEADAAHEMEQAICEAAGPGAKVALLGLTGTALELRRRLGETKAEVVLHEGGLDDEPSALHPALAGAGAIALLDAPRRLRNYDWAPIAALAAPGALVLDAHGLADAEDVRAQGLRYWDPRNKVRPDAGA